MSGERSAVAASTVSFWICSEHYILFPGAGNLLMNLCLKSDGDMSEFAIYIDDHNLLKHSLLPFKLAPFSLIATQYILKQRPVKEGAYFFSVSIQNGAIMPHCLRWAVPSYGNERKKPNIFIQIWDNTEHVSGRRHRKTVWHETVHYTVVLVTENNTSHNHGNQHPRFCRNWCSCQHCLMHSTLSEPWPSSPFLAANSVVVSDQELASAAALAWATARLYQNTKMVY